MNAFPLPALMAMAFLACGLLAGTCRAAEPRAPNLPPAALHSPASAASGSLVSVSLISGSPISVSLMSASLISESLASASGALDRNCALELENALKERLDKEAIVRMQQDLMVLGYSPEWIDGAVGPRTRQALEQFCARARFALSTDLLAMLQNHAAISRVYPKWVETLASSGFAAWAGGEPDADEIGLTKAAGASAEVIAVLDRYRRRKVPAPVARPASGAQVSYMLSAENFRQLKAGGEVLKRIKKMQGKTFPGKQEFETAVDGALKGADDPDKYMKLVWNTADPQASRKLSDESFNRLRVENVPAFIVQSLQALKDLSYPPGRMEGAVNAVVNGLAQKTADFSPGEIVSLAEVSKSGTATFTAASLAKFADAHKDDPAAAAIQGKLLKLQKVEYQSVKTMTAAMKNLLRQEAEEIRAFQPVILASTVETEAYGLTEASVEGVDKQTNEFTMPEIYLEMLADLQDVSYPEQDLFWRAAKAKLSMAGSNNIMRKALVDALNPSMDTVDEPLLDKLRAGGWPPAAVKLAGSLQGRKFADAEALEDGVSSLFDDLAEGLDHYRQLLIPLAAKTHPPGTDKVIEWNGDSCNCVHDSLYGQVYGFYPYWMAGGKQNIDFSVQTRFGFYALGFDDKGNIANPSEWTNLDTGFIREARTYGSKVDLVLHKDNWEEWSRYSLAEKNESFDKLATGIAGLLSTPLSGLSSTLIPYASLGASKQPVMGDGVTLYFEGYPRDGDSVGSFAAFVKSLKGKLQAQGRPYTINIMFRSAEIGVGVYEYHKLLDLAKVEKGSKVNVFYPVLLQEPTTDDKKLLRLKIEDGLHGEERMTLLRNVVTVLTYDGRTKDQLKDDVIYAKDNFGGIGFWPQPIIAESSVAGTAVTEALHDNYLGSAKEDVLGVCKYVCPNKWAFRITWGIFVLALLLSVVMRFVSCPWRVLFDDNFIYFIGGLVVPSFLLSLALLFCDPGWAEISRGNGLLIFVIIAIIAYSIWNYHDKKNSAEMP